MASIERPSGTIELIQPTGTHYIYRFYNTVNQKSYVGRTNDLQQRISDHLSGKGSTSLLADLVEYGRQAFEISILETIASDDDALVNTVEDYFILKHNCLAGGYNRRLNRDPTPNGAEVNQHGFQVTAKHVYLDGRKPTFTVGAGTNAESYQTIVNLLSQLDAEDSGHVACIRKLNRFGFNYFQLTVEPRRGQTYEVGDVYDLHLSYNEGRLQTIPDRE